MSLLLKRFIKYFTENRGIKLFISDSSRLFRKPRFCGQRMAPYSSQSDLLSSQSEVSSISSLSQRIERLKQKRQYPSRVLYSKKSETASDLSSESSYIPSSAKDLQRRLANVKKTKNFIQKHKRNDTFDTVDDSSEISQEPCSSSLFDDMDLPQVWNKCYQLKSRRDYMETL